MKLLRHSPAAMQRDAQVAREDSATGLQFEDIFSLRKPRDAKAGLASGLKSMAKGVLAGSVGLVGDTVRSAGYVRIQNAAQRSRLAAARARGTTHLPCRPWGGRQSCWKVVAGGQLHARPHGVVVIPMY